MEKFRNTLISLSKKLDEKLPERDKIIQSKLGFLVDKFIYFTDE